MHGIQVRHTQNNKYLKQQVCSIFVISQEGKLRMKLIFLLECKHQSFLQGNTIIFGFHAQSTQNNNLTISMQYLNKDERDRLRSMFLKRTHFGIVFHCM